MTGFVLMCGLLIAIAISAFIFSITPKGKKWLDEHE